MQNSNDLRIRHENLVDKGVLFRCELPEFPDCCFTCKMIERRDPTTNIDDGGGVSLFNYNCGFHDCGTYVSCTCRNFIRRAD